MCIVIWFWLPSPEKAVAYFETTDQILDNEDDVLIQKSSCKTFCHYVNAINTAPRNIGKDGKFQILVCLGTRYKASSWLSLSLLCFEQKSRRGCLRSCPLQSSPMGSFHCNFYYETMFIGYLLCIDTMLSTHWILLSLPHHNTWSSTVQMYKVQPS